jgi:hypothetical protein
MSRLDDYFDTSLNGMDRTVELFKIKLGRIDQAVGWLMTAAMVTIACVFVAPFWAYERLCGLLSRK